MVFTSISISAASETTVAWVAVKELIRRYHNEGRVLG